MGEYADNVQSIDVLFIELPVFKKHRSDYLDDDIFRRFQPELLNNPEAVDAIEGTASRCRIRVVDEQRSKGKRGGPRVIYYWWSGFDQFWLFTLCGKNEQDDLMCATRTPST